ncbi:hypothetical protein [uncultured Desulfovibrio sp.]|uniref:hypothetical protein n=1 Tax=uncultured Desulfovibrio sp. TaxID=167968 RepID=UPI0025D4CBE2|nr:hypothetical protein [uncultured Desulfovibrio sp.]
MYFYRFRNFYSEYVIYLICILCLMTCSCTHISSFSLNTQSQFSPQVNLSNEDKFFLAPDKSLQNNDLIYVNIENSVRSVFQNLGLHVVNLLSQANYFVTINYIKESNEETRYNAIPKYGITHYETQNNIFCGGTRNNFVIHGTTTTKPVYGYTGTELSSYKYIQYYNGVGLKIYSISNNNYNLISDIAIIWKDSTPDIFKRIDLASLVLRELLIAKTTSRRIYTFRWEDNKLSAFTWTPWM